MTFRSTVDTPIEADVAYQAWPLTINNWRQLPRLDSARNESNIQKPQRFSAKDGRPSFLEVDDQSRHPETFVAGKLSSQASSRTTSSGASSIT